MTDGGEIPLVFGVLELNLFFRQPIPINRTNQLLVFLQQSLSEFLSFLFVHLNVPLYPPKPSWFRTGKWEYMLRDRHVNKRLFDDSSFRTGAPSDLTLKRPNNCN